MNLRRLPSIPSACAAAALTVAVAPALAGDLKASVTHGNLVVVGKATGDGLVVDQAGLASGQFRVTPESQTTVNGSAAAQVFDSVAGDVRVTLGGGDELLRFDHVAVAGNVVFKTGKTGAAGFEIEGSTVGGSIKLLSGAKSAGNSVEMDEVTTGGALLLQAPKGTSTLVATTLTVSSGDATIRFGDESQVALQGLVVSQGRLAVTLGSGSTLGLQAVDVAGDVVVAAKGGGSSFGAGDLTTRHGDLVVGLGPTGADSVDLESATVHGALRIDVGKGGGSTVTVSNASVDGPATVSAPGAAQDVVQIGDAGSFAVDLEVTTGAGDDQVTVATSVGRDLVVAAAAGGNVVTINSAVGRNLRVVTGNDADSIDTTGTTVGGKSTIRHGGGADLLKP